MGDRRPSADEIQPLLAVTEEAGLLYVVGLLGVGIPPAWMTFTECQRALDPAPLRVPKAKRYFMVALAWDLMFALSAGAAVFGIQRFAGADLSGLYVETAGTSQRGALVAVVGVLAAGVGVGARSAGGAVARRNRRARGNVGNATKVAVSHPGNPKTRALERLGNLEWLWSVNYSKFAAQDARHLGRDAILHDVGMFFRTKGLTAVVTSMVLRSGDAMTLPKLLASLPKVLDDSDEPSFTRRVAVLALWLLENGGKDFVDDMARRGREAKECGRSKAPPE